MFNFQYMCVDFKAQMTPKRFDIISQGWTKRIKNALQNKSIDNEYATDYLNRLNLLKEGMYPSTKSRFLPTDTKIVPVMNENRRLSGLMELETSTNVNRQPHRYINNLIKNPKAINNPEPYGKLAPLSFKHIKNNYPDNDTIGISGLNEKLDRYYSTTSGLPRQDFNTLRDKIRNRQELLPGNVQGKISDLRI